MGIPFMETSAKELTNIHEVFWAMASELKNRADAEMFARGSESVRPGTKRLRNSGTKGHCSC